MDGVRSCNAMALWSVCVLETPHGLPQQPPCVAQLGLDFEKGEAKDTIGLFILIQRIIDGVAGSEKGLG
jgi:hypothetical protein